MNRALWLLLLLAVPTVAAHAEPYQSEPAGGTRLDEAPGLVRVAFTEPVFREGSWIQVLDSHGHRVDNDDLTIQGEGRPVMSLTLPPDLPDGAFRIAWQTYSVTDGHTVRGSIGFAIGGFAAPDTEVQEEAAFDAIPSLARAILYAGFALGIGSIAFGYVLRTSHDARMLQIGAATALAGTLLLTWDTCQGTGLSAPAYFLSEGGTRMMLRNFVLAALLVLTILWTVVRPGLIATAPVLASLWLIAAFQSAQWGHVTQYGAWGAWLEVIHLVAASAWLGGLVALLRHLRNQECDWIESGRRFGALAAASVTILAATGLALAIALLWPVARTDATAIWNDSWSWFLAFKLTAFGVMVAAAAINRYGYLATQPPAWLAKWLPTSGQPGFRRVIRWEGATAIIAVIAAGMLLSVSPPQSLGPDGPAIERTAQGDVFTALLEVDPTPSTSASHTFRFFINNPDAGEPVINNTCGRDDCIKARWTVNGEAGTEQEATAIPEGHGWWRIDSVLFTETGASVVVLDIQTGYVYLDTLTFDGFDIQN